MKLNLNQIEPLIKMAVAEDLGTGDVTSRLFIKENPITKAHIVSREEIIVCGMRIVELILKQYDENLSLKVHIEDGKAAHVGSRLATISGPLVPMLSAERVLLNFLQRLSGISTTTQKYVKAVSGTKAKICDTRKTIPGWRVLEKYAVRCGGGFNHRMGLYDGILIKDNHIAHIQGDFYKGLVKVVEEARQVKGIKFVAVEVYQVVK